MKKTKIFLSENFIEIKINKIKFQINFRKPFIICVNTLQNHHAYFMRHSSSFFQVQFFNINKKKQLNKKLKN
jgi:hypothetical protein